MRRSSEFTNSTWLDASSAESGAIGFCFGGGKCVLELARSGANVKSVVSFHGFTDPDIETLTGVEGIKYDRLADEVSWSDSFWGEPQKPDPEWSPSRCPTK
jgi:dienelactone hydrolase